MKLQKVTRKMRGMGRGKFFAAVAAGIALLAANIAHAETITVANGESLTLDTATNNKAGNQITLQDGATLIAPVPDGGDGYWIKANVYVAGAARIDLASTPTSAYYLRFAGGLIAANDTCSLTVGGGLTQAFFGLQASDRTPEADVAVDGTGIHYPIINLKNFLFDATERGTFTIRSDSASTIVQIPTTCNLRFVDGSATLALKGNDVFAQLGQTAPYSLTNFNAVVLDSAAIPAGSKVKVAAGHTLAIKPCNISGTWNWTGIASDVNFDVELEAEDSVLLFRTKNTGWTRFVGNVTGEGKVYVRGEDNNSQSRVTFDGNIACRGGLETKAGIADVRFGPDAGWRAKVKHWFDAADTNSYVMFTAEPPAGRTTQVGNDTDGYYDTIVGWKDTVKGTNDVFCYNTRMWRNNNPPKKNYVLEVLPYIVPNGLNGLNYISFGLCGGKCTEGWGLNTDSTNARRLPFWRGEADGANQAAGAPASSTCKYAIMVYGSQQGGGMSLLGSVNDTQTQTMACPNRWNGTDQSWIGSHAANFNMVVDGEAVNPASDKPNGGWQIVALEVTNKTMTVNSLGAQTAAGPDSTAAGGQNYAEVILFDSALTEAERTACERYLAKKWGLTASYQGGMASGEYRLNSTNANTSVTVFGDVTLTGVYEGTVNVDDRSSISFARQMPPTEADLPSADRVGWYDPDFDLTRKMRTTNANRPLELDGIFCRTADGIDTTHGWFGGARGTEASNRCPWIDEGSRNGGPSRHWIVFRDIYLQDNDGKYYGNMLRYKTATFNEDNVKTTTSTTFNMRQVFMVLDTSEGGGTPLLDKADASGVVRARFGTTVPGDNYTKSIHANGGRKTEGVFLNGKAWLNKMEVDPYTHGFTGKPEILTLQTTGDFPAGFLGYYGKQDYKTFTANFEIIGETIFYSAPLSDEDRAKVQDYLMYKWLGKIDSAVYSDASAASVSGSGRVTAAGFADPSLPTLSPSFTGTLAVTTNDLAFTVGSPVMCGHAVELPDTCTITVAVPANTESGTYTLLAASSVKGGANATLALPQGSEGKYEGQLVLSGDTLSIALKRFNGMTIIVR